MTNADHSDFKYHTLQTQSRQIRLAILEPSSKSTDVDCSLQHTSLNEPPVYEALSYTWGDPSKLAHIKLGGYSFPVNRSLATCLQNLRHGDSKVVKLWIDALCVNQKDEEEQSWQVSQMKDIYEEASKIVIWLGEAADNSSLAMKTMSEIFKLLTTRPSSSTPKDVLISQIEQVLDPEAMMAIALIFKRPWWARAWIIQEATCPAYTTLRCGSDEIDVKAAFSIAKFITKRTTQQALRQDFQNPDITDFYRVIAMNKIRLDRSPNGHLDILSLLEQSRNCEASDPRDKLFAFSGLANAARKGAMDPNYSLRLDQAYTRFCCNLIKIERNLNIFGHCQDLIQTPDAFHSFKLLPSSMRPRRPLPSWTPDWTLNLETTPFIKNEMNDDTSSPQMYWSSKDYPPYIKPCDEDGELQMLSVRGCIFDTVLKLGPDSKDLLHSSLIEQWYGWALENLKKMYSTDETTHEAVLHTFVADIGESGRRFQRGGTLPWPIDIQQGTNRSFLSNSLVKMALHSRTIFISKLGYLGLARYDV